MWDPGSSVQPNRLETEESDKRDDVREKKRRVGTGERSRSATASPNVLGNSCPVSVRQQLALLKQMEQLSPSGSTDGDGRSTPKTKKKKVARVHKKNDRGETPLHVAARKGIDQDCIELINQGADVNCADYAGWTPLHEACNHNRFETAELLLRNGADVNKASADGETPLHDAAFSNNAKLVWLLLRHGADRESRNTDNQRPIDIVDPSTTYELLLTATLPEECPLSEPSTRSCTPNNSSLCLSSTTLPLVQSADFLQNPENENDSATLFGLPADCSSSTTILCELPTNMPLTVSVAPPYEVTAPPAVSLNPEYLAESAQQSQVNCTDIEPVKEMEPIANIPTTSTGVESEAEALVPSISSLVPIKEVQPTESLSIECSGLDNSEGNVSSSGSVAEVVAAAEDENPVEPQVEKSSPIAVSPLVPNDTITCEPMKEEESLPKSEVSQNRLQEMEQMVGSDSGSSPRGGVEEESGQLASRPAVWKAGTHLRNATLSPNHPYDFVEEIDDSRDEVRSESGLGKRRGVRGRPRGVRASSGSSTPITSTHAVLAANDRKRSGRGRGSRRGRSVLHDTITESPSTSFLCNVEDVYDFRESPESEDVADYGDEKEGSVPPSSKRIRLTDPLDIDVTDNTTCSNHSEEVDCEMDYMDEDDDTGKCITSGRKVPPLRISLTKTPSEEDNEDEPALLPVVSRGKTVGRGRPGRKGISEQDEAQRMTRSKVRQTGKILNDCDPWAKKKRGRPAILPDSAAEEDNELPDELSQDRATFDTAADPVDITDLPASQKVLRLNSYLGALSMKKMMACRWVDDLRRDFAKIQSESEKYQSFMICKGDYHVDESSKVEPKSEDISQPVPAELLDLWTKQEEERESLSSRLNVEKIRLQLCAEQEFMRCHLRNGESLPRMSAVRMFREMEICNPLMLDEPVGCPPPIQLSDFEDSWRKRIASLYQRQRMESEALCSHQRQLWKIETNRLSLQMIPGPADNVPHIHVTPLDLTFMSLDCK